MTLIKKGLIAAIGFLAVGAAVPASALGTAHAKPTGASGEVSGVQLVGDRYGSWSERRRDERHDDRRYSHDRRFDEHRYRKHYKTKRKVYRRGYDEGYRDARRDYRFRRHSYYRNHHHHDRFRGGVYFGDGYYGGGVFRFRY